MYFPHRIACKPLWKSSKLLKAFAAPVRPNRSVCSNPYKVKVDLNLKVTFRPSEVAKMTEALLRTSHNSKATVGLYYTSQGITYACEKIVKRRDSRNGHNLLIKSINGVRLIIVFVWIMNCLKWQHS